MKSLKRLSLIFLIALIPLMGFGQNVLRFGGKSTDLSGVPDIIAAYNMIPNGATLTDIAGSNDGTITGTTTTSRGLFFNGSSDFVQSANAQQSYPFTITCRFRLLAISGTGTSSILSILDDASATKYFELQVKNAGLSIYVNRRNTTLKETDTGEAVVLGEWLNIVVSFPDNTSIIVNINGIEVLNSAVEDVVAIDNTFDTLLMGVLRVVSPTNYANCEIADVQVYDIVFTENQSWAYHTYASSLVKTALVDDNTNVLTIPEYLTALYDGTTVGWYVYNALQTITKDGSELVLDWEDKLGSGRDLEQADGGKQPTWSATGITFDGVDNYMKVTGGFAYTQPEIIYIVYRLISYTNDRYVFDGGTDNTGVIINQAPSPNSKAFAGAFSGANANLVVGSFGIIRVLFNGASSSYQIDETAAVTGNFGASDMGGFTLASKSDGTSPGNIQVKEIILRNTADDAATQAIIYNYLATKYDLSMWLVILLIPALFRRKSKLRIAA